MLTSTKIRLYPDASQAEKLAKAFGCVRWLWNNSLAETQKVYHETGKGVGQFALNNRLPALKKEFDWLSEPHSQVLQSVNLHLSRAFVNFFEKRAAYPDFNSKHERQAIQYPQGVKVVEGRKLYLPKIGHVKAEVHRDIVGVIKTVTVSKEPSGKYYASILTETGEPAPAISLDGKVLGLDVGLTHLAIISDGSKFNNSRHVARAENNLKRKQRQLSRKVKGSKRRNKARLVCENQVIAVGDLHVKGLMKNPNLAKAIGDVGWGMLTTMLQYKTARAGKGYLEVNRFFPSSKTCSGCGHVMRSLPLSVRAWTCPQCGALYDRMLTPATTSATKRLD